MTDPRRLIEEVTRQRERAVLKAAVDEAPPDGAAGRTLAVLGLGAALVGTGATATAAAATGAAASLPPAAAATGVAGGATTVAAVGGVATLKWVGGGVLACALAAGGWQIGERVSTPVRPAHTAVASVSAQVVAALPPPVEATPTEAPESAPPREDEPVAAADAPQRRAPVRPVTEPAPEATPPPRTASPLAPELALVDGARDAIAAKQADRAVALLDRYQREFPNGQLAQEARLLRVEALMLRGDRARAEDEAQRALRESPDTPHADRMRSLIDAGVGRP